MSFSELELIQLIHQFRTPLLDEFFKALDFFDRPEFFLILIPAIWLGYSWKMGFKLFYLVVFLNHLVNAVLKEFFLSPRPFHLDPQLGIIQVSGYGFPSGAAQSVILLSGLLIMYWKSAWKWGVALIYILLISFSRIYLGVHFPSDILGGWMVGGCLWLMFICVEPFLEKQLEKLNLISLFLISQFVPLFLLIGFYSFPAIRVCSIAMGMGVGLCINDYQKWLILAPNGYKEIITRVGIGILSTYLCYEAIQFIPFLFIQFFFIGIWISLGTSLLIRAMFPANKPSIQKI